MRVLKRATAMVLAASMIASLTACGSSGKSAGTADTAADTTAAKTESKEEGSSAASGEAAENGDAVTIRMSWWGGDSRHEVTNEAIKAFEAKYPNIKVDTEYSSWDGWAEKCSTALVAGTAPDVMQVNWNWLYQFSADGSKFVDLNEYKDIISLQNYPEKILDQCVVADKLQALPIGTTGKCFFWNKTTFEKAGLETPKTIDDLMNAGTVFKETLGDDYYPIAMFGYERMLLMLYYLQSKYGKQWVEDGKVNYSLEEVKEGLDWICSLEENHVMPTIGTLIGSGSNVLEKTQGWIEGKYAGFYEWDSAQVKFEQALDPGQEFVLGDFITGIGEYEAGLTKISQCFAVTESSKHKKEAAMLVEFLTSDPEGVAILGTERGMLANSEANKTLEESGKLEGLTYEANKAVMEVANFSFDPNFEDSALKDSTGVYYEVFEAISDGEDTQEWAEYLIDSVNEVNEKKSY